MAADPLLELTERIRNALTLPDPQPYAPNQNPLGELRRALSQTPANDTNFPQTTTSALADEVLDILARTPLSGDARRRAIDVAFSAKNDPTKENVQRVLDILVGG